MPSHKGEIEYFQNTFERFKAITSLINYGEHMTKLYQQCEKIARKPGRHRADYEAGLPIPF